MLLKDHFLALVNVTEVSALACYSFIGKGEAEAADRAAVSAMRSAFNSLPMDIRIVIRRGRKR